MGVYLQSSFSVKAMSFTHLGAKASCFELVGQQRNITKQLV